MFFQEAEHPQSNGGLADTHVRILPQATLSIVFKLKRSGAHESAETRKSISRVLTCTTTTSPSASVASAPRRTAGSFPSVSIANQNMRPTSFAARHASTEVAGTAVASPAPFVASGAQISLAVPQLFGNMRVPGAASPARFSILMTPCAAAHAGAAASARYVPGEASKPNRRTSDGSPRGFPGPRCREERADVEGHP